MAAKKKNTDASIADESKTAKKETVSFSDRSTIRLDVPKVAVPAILQSISELGDMQVTFDGNALDCDGECVMEVFLD